MQAFERDSVLARVREAVEPIPNAAMFELAERVFVTPFQQLDACLISIRTRDAESLPISERLFNRAATSEEIAALPPRSLAH